MNNVLLLEDDAILSKEINEFLIRNNYTCDYFYDGSIALKKFSINKYDLAILDINVPGISGIELCRNIRIIDTKIPILMLTAFSEVEEKVSAFDKGANDYMVKPFHFDELLARLKSLLRRSETPQLTSDIVTIDDLVIDKQKMKVSRAGSEINLSPKEFKLLNILANSGGRVLSKPQIADMLWDYHIETNQNTIEVYINFLRKKIDKNFDKKLIQTKVGFGYYLKQDEIN